MGHILFVDQGTGAADLAIDPEDPNIIYAAMWSVNINTWGLNSGGEGGGIYKSIDGGDRGLSRNKNRPVGKTAIAVSHSNLIPFMRFLK